MPCVRKKRILVTGKEAILSAGCASSPLGTTFDSKPCESSTATPSQQTMWRQLYSQLCSRRCSLAVATLIRHSPCAQLQGDKIELYGCFCLVRTARPPETRLKKEELALPLLLPNPAAPQEKGKGDHHSKGSKHMF